MGNNSVVSRGYGWGESTVEFWGWWNCSISWWHASVHVLKFIQLYHERKKLILLRDDFNSTISEELVQRLCSSHAMFGCNVLQILGLQCLESSLPRPEITPLKNLPPSPGNYKRDVDTSWLYKLLILSLTFSTYSSSFVSLWGVILT